MTYFPTNAAAIQRSAIFVFILIRTAPWLVLKAPGEPVRSRSDSDQRLSHLTGHGASERCLYH